MKPLTLIGLASCACVLLDVGAAQAQGRGSGIWTTTGGDAQRSSSMRTDPRISADSLSRPGFQLLWKRQLEPATGVLTTQPVFSAPGFITYKGFKGLAYLGGSSNTVYSIDYDLNRVFWTRSLGAPLVSPQAGCSVGVTAATEITPLAPVGGLRLGGPPAGRAAGSAPAGPAAARGRGAAPGGRGRGAEPSGGRGRPNAVAALYVLSADGLLHALNLMDGGDWFTPVRLLPAPRAEVTGAIVADDVIYAGTAGNCGGVPNGVYAMDLTPAPAPARSRGELPVPPNATPASTTVVRWESRGGSVVGAGPALGRDGTVYVATADGDYSPTAFSDAVVALEPATLRQKDYFTPGKTPFTTSPVVFQLGGRDLVAVANQDGRIYVLDSSSLGGPDHKTPLAALDAAGAGAPRLAGLATVEADGARWIVWAGAAPLSTPKDFLAAARVSEKNGAVTLDRAWISPQASPSLTPAIVNGVVFGLSTGSASGSNPAVLSALDLATGRELWNSGTAIASQVNGIGPAIDDGQVYVVGTDGALYAFGFVVER